LISKTFGKPIHVFCATLTPLCLTLELNSYGFSCCWILEP